MCKCHKYHKYHEIRSKEAYQGIWQGKRLQINLGSFAISAVKFAAKESEDDDAVVAIRAMDNLSGVSLVGMEKCGRNIKDQFHKRLVSILGDGSLLMSVKNEDDEVLFYGKSSADVESIEDLIIYNPEDGEMIGLWGSISTEGVAELVKSHQE